MRNLYSEMLPIDVVQILTGKCQSHYMRLHLIGSAFLRELTVDKMGDTWLVRSTFSDENLQIDGRYNR